MNADGHHLSLVSDQQSNLVSVRHLENGINYHTDSDDNTLLPYHQLCTSHKALIINLLFCVAFSPYYVLLISYPLLCTQTRSKIHIRQELIVGIRNKSSQFDGSEIKSH